MEGLAKRFDASTQSVFVYTREAHPGEKHPHHTSLDDKIQSARKLIEAFDLERRVLVDDLSGQVHRAYGGLPNMTYVVRRRGVVPYRATWTVAGTVELALEQLAFEREHQREGGSTLPYYMEWNPARARDRIAFMRSMLAGGGARAVEEFLEATAAAFGDAYAEPLRRWWAETRGG